MTDCSILIICCEKTKEIVDEAGLNAAVMSVPCLGRIDEALLIRAFRKGADGVIVAGCVDGNCRYSSGNYQARRCVNEVKNILNEISLSGERLEIVNVASNDILDLLNSLQLMKETLLRLGKPNILEADI